MFKLQTLIDDLVKARNNCIHATITSCNACGFDCICAELGYLPEDATIDELLNDVIKIEQYNLIFELVISRNDALLPAENWHPIHTERFTDFSTLLKAVDHTKAFSFWQLDFFNKCTSHNESVDGGVKYEYTTYLERGNL